MIGYKYGLNSGLLQLMTRTCLVGSTLETPVQLISPENLSWIFGLSRKSLRCLDKIPISLLRFRFNEHITRTAQLEDLEYVRTSLNLSLVSEVVNYVNLTDYDSFLVSGVPQNTFNWFTSRSLSRRILACENIGFSVIMPSNHKHLRMNDSKEAALENTCIILGSEVADLIARGPEYPLGHIRDFGVKPHQTDMQMREMIDHGLRPLTTSALTGIDIVKVSNYARSNAVRRSDAWQPTKGRTPSVEISFQRNITQANLFMLIYEFTGSGIADRTNTRAGLYAYMQTAELLKHMGFKPSETININDAFNVVMGVLAGQIMRRSCQKCGVREFYLPTRKGGCYLCDG